MRLFKSIIISLLCIIVVDQLVYVARIRPMALAIRAASVLLNSERAMIAAQSAALACSTLFHSSSVHKKHSRVCVELDSYAYSIMQTPWMTYHNPRAHELIQDALAHPENYEEPSSSTTSTELHVPVLVKTVSQVSARQLASRQSALGAAFFTTYDSVIPQRSWYTVHHTSNEMRVSTDAGLYASVRVRPRNQAASHYEHEQALREHALAIICLRAIEDPSYIPALRNRIETTIRLLAATNSSDFIERLSARLQLPYVELEEPYGSYARWAANQLLGYYCESDGSISPHVARSNVTSYYVQAFIQNGVREPAYQRCFSYPAKVSDAEAESWGHAFQRICVMPSNMVQIAKDNAGNKDLLQVLHLCQSCDFAAASEVERTYDGVQQELLKKIIDYYRAQWKKVLCDADGFYLIAQSDPLCASLSITAKQEIARDATVLQQYNDILLCRYTLKQKIMQAWNIPSQAPREIYDALYSLLNADAFVDGAHTIDAVENILGSSSEKACSSLVQHFFLPNGILRDFSHYDYATCLPACPELLRAEYAPLRTALNYAVYKDHVDPSPDLKKFIESVAEHIRNRAMTPAVQQQLLVDACWIIPQKPWQHDEAHIQLPIEQLFLAKEMGPGKESPKIPPPGGGGPTPPEDPEPDPEEEKDPTKTPKKFNVPRQLIEEDKKLTWQEKIDQIIEMIIGKINKQPKAHKGKEMSTIYVKTEDTSLADFKLFEFIEIKVTKDGKTVGFLPDGRRVVHRPVDLVRQKKTTLEIQNINGTKIKFRYP